MELDFIRGIAILLVLDFHSPVSPLRKVFLALGFQDHIGWIGVDIFFVLSGFLVGGLVMKEWKLRRGFDVKRFLIRRGLKIWPPYYLYLAVLLATRHYKLAQLWGNLLNIQNYTGGIAHTWSLAVEEHCYLLLALCMLVATRRRVSPRGLFFVLLTVCVLETPFRYLLVYSGHLIFLPTHARLDGIGYGVLLAMLFHFWPEHFARLRPRPWLWASVVLVGLLDLRPYNMPLPYFVQQHDAATFVAIGTLLLLYRPLPKLQSHGRLYRLVARIGLYSYGIYLWHVAAIGPCMTLLQRIPFLPAVLQTVIIWAVQIALGAGMTHCCELPVLRLRDLLFPRRVDSATGVPAALESGEVAAGSHNSGGTSEPTGHGLEVQQYSAV